MKYHLELIPINEGARIIRNGVNYTAASQQDNIVINGQRYFLFRNHQGEIKALEWLMESGPFLKEITRYLSNKRAPLKITIEQGETEEP
jgi:hypothetical protein